MPEAHQRHRPQPGQKGQDDAITDVPFRRVGTDLLDDPGALVSSRDRVVAELQVARRQVVIGMAQTRSHHPDQQFALPGPVEIDLGDLPLSRPLAAQSRSLSSSESSTLDATGTAGTTTGWSPQVNLARNYRRALGLLVVRVGVLAGSRRCNSESCACVGVRW